MSKKILLIDDSKTQLQSLKIILTRAGYDVTTAEDAISAMEITSHSLPDLIISDIVMPNINGYHLCRLLKNAPRTKDVPVILLTILNTKMDKFWGLKAGADKYINKDSKPQELISAVEELLKNHPQQKDIVPFLTKKEVHFDEQIYQAKINKILDESLIESTIMNEFRNLSEYINDDTKLVKEIFSLMDSILEFDVAGVFFNGSDPKDTKTINIDISTTALSEKSLEALTDEFFFKIDPSLKKDMVEYKIYDTEASSINVTDEINEFRTSLIIPMTINQKIIGGVCVHSKKHLNYEGQKTFKIILSELRHLMHLKNLHSQTRLLTIVDPLTTLYNRRYFNEILAREFSRARRYDIDFSIAMFDIDNFKKLNDTYGHQFGDEVLQEVSKIILSSLRNTDFAFRYGGEEMVAILTNSQSKDAFIPIERIRKKIEDKVFHFKDAEIKVSVSAGMTSTLQKAQTAEELVKLADQALYISKETGKNKVSIYGKE